MLVIFIPVRPACITVYIFKKYTHASCNTHLFDYRWVVSTLCIIYLRCSFYLPDTNQLTISLYGY